MSQLADDLRAAKALINRPSKWCKDSYHSGGFHGFARHCTLGAVMTSTPNHDQRDAMYRALEKALTGSARKRPHALATYNDTHTHRDVMAWFDRAISNAETSA